MLGKSSTTQIWRQLGFELIELMIVVAISLMLASIASPHCLKERPLAMNTAAQCELKMAKTSLEGHSVTEGDSYFNGGSTIEIDTFALDFESSDNLEIGYSRSKDTFEISAWHHNSDKCYSINSYLKAISKEE